MPTKKLPKKLKRNNLIVVDGGDGSGKTTLVKMLSDLFPKSKLTITREPGGSPFAEKIRALARGDDAKDAPAETHFGLMWAARADHIERHIKPLLAKGHVVSDRFDSSTYAFQIYGQQNKKLEDLFWKTRAIYLRELKPAVYIFVDVPPEIGRERVQKRAATTNERTNHFDEMPLDYYARIRKGYRAFLKKVPHVVVNGNQPFELVVEEFKSKIEPYLH